MLDEVEGFDWDVHNIHHIARHGVAPMEVHEAVEGAHIIIPTQDVKGEKRWKLLGKSLAGRYLIVVFGCGYFGTTAKWL